MAWPTWALDAWTRAQPYAQKLAVWEGYERELQTLAIYGVGIAIYTALVFTFYQTLSRRKPLHFKLGDRLGWRGRVGRTAERIVAFPVASFLYFAVLALALFVMAKSQSVEQILLLSMATIVGVRVTVYLSEAMSNDLAKLVPLSLIAVVLVDPGYLTLSAAWGRFVDATQMWPLLGRYFLLFIALEGVMGAGRWTALHAHARYTSWRRSRSTTSFSIEVKEPPPAPAPSPAPTTSDAPGKPRSAPVSTSHSSSILRHSSGHMVLEAWVDRFAVWNGFHPDLQTLLTYGVGIAIYTALVFTFYQNISRRDPLHSKPRKGWWGRTLHAAETILTFPILSFGYFFIMSMALFVMAKPDRATADILLLSMACVLGVRVTAHLAEGMSNDIAKLLPLSLVAVVVVDPGYLSIAGSFARVGETLAMLPVLAQYFALFILVEAVLRAARSFVPGFRHMTERISRRRHLSKRAMLRDVESEHESASLFRRHHHDHAPRDRATGGDFLALDEHSGGKPGTRQGVGPAIRHEMKHAARAESHVRPAAPRAGPGGKGGKLGTW